MDWAIDDAFGEETKGDAAPPERELVPEGTHTFRIKQVIESDERLEVRLAHDDRRYGWVFAKLPKGAGWAKRIVATLAQACGMTAEQWAATEAGDLAGRMIRAEIYHRAGDRGGTFVNVRRFLPIEEAARPVERAVAPPSARAAVSRPTKTRVADAASNAPSDDIPF